MIVKFSLNSGANIHSTKTVSFDLETERGQKALGFTKEEWLALSDTEKDEVNREWAENHLEIYWSEE